VVKLASGDPHWWNLTALDYHFETQPLPAWTAWYAHQLPAWARKGSVVLMFVLELAVPWLIIAPRRLRLLCAAALTALQLGFAATGNYGFFNLLSAALCLLLVDDATWPSVWTRRLALPRERDRSVRRRWPGRLALPAAALIALFGLMHLAGAFRRQIEWPSMLVTAEQWAASLEIVHGYGLFARMTTSRPEIIVEGSEDGMTWQEYEFKWKPGDVNREPVFVGLHMPRLDWQMWFAALGSCRSTPWFGQFLQKLMEGSPQVLALLERNPFPAAPPAHLRALLYEYHFTDTATRQRTGAWWRRDLKGLYCPVLSSRPRSLD
ncbi:MAG TPA: lipase maturation factor family protein, partial [Candidatus Polarisedimenticolia bacterium]|nr:lipase maturation factor family protein [Candidatus Polarisedimenticolia bacterium]